MRKMKCFVAVVSVFLFLNACSPIDNWQVVDVAGYGSIQVPEGWTVSVNDEFMYVFSEKDGDRSNILVQYRSDENVNQDFVDIENMTWLQDENFSNGACITKYYIDYQNGLSEELFALCFTGSNDYKSTVFLCMDTSVAESTLKQIAKSYTMFK